MSVLQAGFGSSGGYDISNSLRLRASASAYLSRTFGTPTNNLKWTCSWWTKRGEITTRSPIGSSVAPSFITTFNASNQFEVIIAGTSYFVTSAVFCDPSAHMHLTLVFDSANAVQADRIILYVNGIRAATSTASCPLNQASGFNASSASSSIGRAFVGWYGDIRDYFDGLMSDVYFIDGQALTPSSFGETNADGVWVPKSYTGTYGTNGFHLDFKDAAVTAGSNAGLGKDVSGNGNYWTTNNISVTAGVTYDALTDTPTNNYATLNPLQRTGGTVPKNGALQTTSTTLRIGPAIGTIGVDATNTTGYYFEIKPSAGLATNYFLGIANIGLDAYDKSASMHVGYIGIFTSGEVYADGAFLGTFTTYTSGNVLGFCIKNGNLYISKDGVAMNSGNAVATGITGIWTAWSSHVGASGPVLVADFNFGQRGFDNTPLPAGSVALCTANLPSVAIKNPKAHFDVRSRAATGGTATVTGYAFAPALTWIKSRTFGNPHYLADYVRGANKFLGSDTTAAEDTGKTDELTAFTSDGYTLGASVNGYTNLTPSARNYVDWNWKAGGAPTTDNVAGAGNTPTAGSVKIDGANLGSALAGSIAAKRLSANTTAGFSIVRFTGTGANATVAHGLGVAPKMVVVKCTDQTNKDWMVWHDGLTADTKALFWNSTAAETTDATYWNSTPPTSSVFSVGSNANTNGNTFNYVAYCFAEIPGYSKFGSYTGNGSTDGPFVYCGFRPRYVMVKKSSGTADWILHDTARSAYNVGTDYLIANGAAAETTGQLIDDTANGFKPRGNDSAINTTSATYIFAAFAEHPFGGGNVAPAPAR